MISKDSLKNRCRWLMANNINKMNTHFLLQSMKHKEDTWRWKYDWLWKVQRCDGVKSINVDPDSTPLHNSISNNITDINKQLKMTRIGLLPKKEKEKKKMKPHFAYPVQQKYISSNTARGEMYSIQHYVCQWFSPGRIPPPIKMTATL